MASKPTARSPKAGPTGRTPKAINAVDFFESIGRIEKIGPTHARDLHQLAGVSLSIRQGEPWSSMRLDFELSCGTARLTIDGQDLEIYLRLCHVTLQRQNADIVPHSSYEHQLTGGSYDANLIESNLSESKKGVSFDAEAGISAGVSGINSLLGKVGINFSRKRSRSHKNQATVHRKPRVDLIVTSGQDRWQIGDADLGDVRRSEGHLLGSYFGELRDSDGDPQPLCILARTRAQEPVELTVQATAPITHLRVSCPDGSPAEVDGQAINTTIRRNSNKAVKDHLKRRAELKARIAGLVAAKGISEAQKQAGLNISDGEFVIAIQTLILPECESTLGIDDQ